MRHHPHLLAPLVLALSACGAGAAEDPGAAHAPSPSVDAAAALASGWIRVAPTTAQAVPARIDAPGRVVVRADADARLSMPGPGRVREVLVREGSHVEPGTPLVVFDSAEAAQVRAEVAALDVELRAARAELDRQGRLGARGVGLAVEALRAEAAVRRAEAALAAARSTAALFGPGDGGTVTLRAPMAGVVVDVDARPGLVATPESGPLVSVAHTEALQVRLDVYEDELRRIAAGQPVQVVPADGSAPARGTVVEVADAADPATRRGPVLVALDGRPHGWVAGRHVRGRIDADAPADLAVPVASVVIRPDRSRVVYVEQDGALRPRTVEVGRVVDGLVPVLGGLGPDDRIVVEGALLVDAMADRLL